MHAALRIMGILLDNFDRKFAGIHSRSLQILSTIGDDHLYIRPRELPQTFAMFTVGEYLLRSAATVEQTFGGITTRLWDDPFEWTLPEKLNSTSLVAEYLDEVERTRKKGLAFLSSDVDLHKQMPAPSEIKPIFEILLDTLLRAEHYQGRAAAVVQYFSDEKLPRL
jgi:hypothetical protein